MGGMVFLLLYFSGRRRVIHTPLSYSVHFVLGFSFFYLPLYIHTVRNRLGDRKVAIEPLLLRLG